MGIGLHVSNFLSQTDDRFLKDFVLDVVMLDGVRNMKIIVKILQGYLVIDNFL